MIYIWTVQYHTDCKSPMYSNCGLISYLESRSLLKIIVHWYVSDRIDNGRELALGCNLQRVLNWFTNRILYIIYYIWYIIYEYYSSLEKSFENINLGRSCFVSRKTVTTIRFEFELVSHLVYRFVRKCRNCFEVINVGLSSRENFLELN